MGVVTKAKKVHADPRKVNFFFRSRMNEILLLARRRQFGALGSYFITGLTSWSPFEYVVPRLAALREDPHLIRPVRDFEMVLDVTDPGLSKELLLYGTREDKLASIFERELAEFCSRAEHPVIVDLGANIGYYTLIEARACDGASIVAIEPVPKNVALLRQNLSHNEVADRVSVHQQAIGGENGITELQLATRSNHHRLADVAELGTEYGDTIEVAVSRLDDFVRAQEIDPESVTVVRMDIEGAERDALRGMSDILEADGPTLLYIEVHNNLLDEEVTQEMADLLESHDFELVAVEADTITWSPFDYSLGIESFDELPSIDSSFGLIVKKRKS